MLPKGNAVTKAAKGVSYSLSERRQPWRLRQSCLSGQSRDLISSCDMMPGQRCDIAVKTHAGELHRSFQLKLHRGTFRRLVQLMQSARAIRAITSAQSSQSIWLIAGSLHAGDERDRYASALVSELIAVKTAVSAYEYMLIIDHML